VLEDVDPGVVALTGSENRALVLGALANASGPLSGYRIAQMIDAQRIKVNAELRRLQSAGLVAQRKTRDGGAGWVLEDPDLRRFLRRRIRVVFSSDWDDGRALRGRAVDRLLAEIEAGLPDPKQSPEFYRPPGWKPSGEVMRTIREKVRAPQKDAILRRYGARTSRREGKTA
jgi:biotin operon repressor